MPGTPTTKYQIPTMDGSADLARDIDTLVNNALAAVDSKMAGYSEGTLASRPVSTGGSPGIAGRVYRVTNVPGRYDIDNGTGWDQLYGSTRGKSIIATTESRTNTAYGLMTTPDRVQNVVLPTDGLIAVAFQGLFKSSVARAGRAAIFIDANQLVVGTGQGAPREQAAVTPASGTEYTHLVSHPLGLAGTDAASAVVGDATTGQAVGLHSENNVGSGQEIGGLIAASTPVQVGGVCRIFAAAGTYDVSVQFKASSGSVTAKSRKLWVWTMGF